MFPGRATVVDQIARLLDQQPDEEAELEEFGRLVRLLVDVVPQGPQALFAADTLAEGVPQGEPEMFSGATATACEEFARRSGGARIPRAPRRSALPKPWDGAHELLRQATYYAMKRRAGTVGERGLGRLIGQLAARGARACGCIWSGTASAAGWCRSRCAGCPRACAR